MQFSCMLYCSMTGSAHTHTHIDKAKHKTFARKSNVMKQIPPTTAVLEQHVKKATYQRSYVWGKLLFATPTLPLLTDWA